MNTQTPGAAGTDQSQANENQNPPAGSDNTGGGTPNGAGSPNEGAADAKGAKAQKDAAPKAEKPKVEKPKVEKPQVPQPPAPQVPQPPAPQVPQPPAPQERPPVPTKTVNLDDRKGDRELPIGESESEFFKEGGTHTQTKAHIYVKILAVEDGWNPETRQPKVVRPEKMNKFRPAYWFNIHRQGKGTLADKPTDAQELVAYECEENGVMVQYAFR